MKHYTFILSCVIAALLLFPAECFGCASAAIDRSYTPQEEVRLSAFAIEDGSEADLDTLILPKALYTDESGIVKAFSFKLTEGTTLPAGLSLTVNNSAHTVTAKPESSGMVYEYFAEDEIVVSGSAFVYFSAGDKQSKAAELKPIKIVTANKDDWTVSEDGHTLLLYNGTDTEITVPNFYNGIVISTIGGNVENDSFTNILKDDTTKKITSVTVSEGIRNVNHYAFWKITALSEVTLPQSLENIGYGAFGFSGLTSIEFPKGLSGIYPQAFIECRGLTGDIVIPGGVKTVGEAAFYNCPNITGSLVLEEGVEEIGTLAFAGSGVYQHFSSLSLPSTLKKIGCYAFQNCIDIPELTLPEGLEIISDGAFDHMSGLNNTSLTIPSTVTVIGGDYRVEGNTGYGGHVFYDMGKNLSFDAFYVAEGNTCFKAVDGVLYSMDMTRMLAYPRGKRDTVFEVPEGITQIDEMAFSRAAYLNKVVLPDSYEIKTAVPANILNQDGNSLAVALYVYTAVSSVEVKDSNTRYASQNGILYSKDMNTLWYIPTQYKGEINIDPKCERMEKGCVFTAAKSTTGWEKINIPPSVFWIDSDVAKYLNTCFAGCITAAESPYYSMDENGKLAELPYTLKDVNGDEKIESLDAALVLRYLSAAEQNVEINKKAADTLADGYIDLRDVIGILTLS